MHGDSVLARRCVTGDGQMEECRGIAGRLFYYLYTVCNCTIKQTESWDTYKPSSLWRFSGLPFRTRIQSNYIPDQSYPREFQAWLGYQKVKRPESETTPAAHMFSRTAGTTARFISCSTARMPPSSDSIKIESRLGPGGL
jgi:hypothetical protein